MSVLVVKKELIVDNYNTMRRVTGAEVIPVLKGNAYGLGDTETAKLLFDEGAKLLAVSRIEEAERIAAAVPDAEILLLSPYSTEQDAETIVNFGITASVGSYECAVLLNGIAAKHEKKCRVHIAFDTGMGRFGFLPEEAEKAAKAAKYLPNLEICGCFTHLSNCFGKDKKGTLKQLELFKSCVDELEKAGITPGLKHVANSNGALLYPELRLDAVRIGSALLGRVGAKNKAGLKKVGLLECPVCDTRWLPAGHNVGYANTFKVKKPARIAVIPAGYADGLFTEKSNDTFRFRDILRNGWHNFKYLFGAGRLHCTINGKRVPIIGRVGMCSVVADVGGVDCNPGDIAVFEVNPVFINSDVERRYE